MEDEKGVVWITGVVLGAAGVVPEVLRGLVSRITYPGVTGEFEIFGVEPGGGPLVETADWKLYPVRLPSGRIGLMKISTSVDRNELLAGEAQVLRDLEKISGEKDEEATAAGRGPYFFAGQFPNVAETLDADGRFAMMLAFHPALRSYRELQPLSLLTKNARVDLQTGVWILGKTLRLLDFVHRLAKSTIGFVDSSNVLLETGKHGVVFFDFSQAQEHPNDEDCQAEVALAAKMVWFACGGSDTTEPPHDEGIMSTEHHAVFVAFLRELMDGETNAIDAHGALYAMANRIWPKEAIPETSRTKRPFHNWKTYPRE